MDMASVPETAATQAGGAFDPAVLTGKISSVFDKLASNGQSKVDAKEGTFEADVDTARMAEVLGLDEQLIIDDLNMTVLEKEQNAYTKTDLTGQRTVKKGDTGRRLDNPDGGSGEVAGCKITTRTEKVKNVFGVVTGEKTIVSVKSKYLGDFEYDNSEFALGYKELSDGSQLPVLEYIGDGDGIDGNLEIAGATIVAGEGTDIHIPDGLKVMDYMFEGNTNLKYCPPIPSSVTSMHYAFADCRNMKYSTEPTREYKGAFAWIDNIAPELMHNLTGHTIILPDGMEDMSGAFSGCTNLSTGFCCESDIRDAGIYVGGISLDLADDRPNLGLPEGVLNIRSAFEGCEHLEDKTLLDFAQSNLYGLTGDYKCYPKYGGDITPYLTSEFAKNAMNKITNEDAKSYADSVKFLVNDEGFVDPDAYERLKAAGVVLDEALLDKSRAATREEFLRDVHDGDVQNDPELASGGQRSNNYYYDASDEGIHDDLTGLVVSDKKPSGPSSWLQRLAVDGAAGLGIAGVTSKVSGSGTLGTIAGVAGAVALDYFDVIPESLSPILAWTRDILPDGKIKDKVSEWADALSGSHIKEQLENLTAENVAATYQNRRLQRSIYGIKGAYELGSVDKSMYNNAKYCGENLNFKATADAAMRDGEGKATAGAREVVKVSIDSMEATFAKSGNTDAMKEYYVGLMTALESYNKGANAGIGRLPNDDYKAASKQGLTMLNRAYVDEVMQSLKEMDAKYHFMDDESWDKMSGLNISGVDIANIRNYDKAKIDELSAMSVAQVKSIVENAGEDYVVGVIQETKPDGSSFYNEGDGRFYNEGSDAAGKKATEPAKQPEATKAASDDAPNAEAEPVPAAANATLAGVLKGVGATLAEKAAAAAEAEASAEKKKATRRIKSQREPVQRNADGILPTQDTEADGPQQDGPAT